MNNKRNKQITKKIRGLEINKIVVIANTTNKLLDDCNNVCTTAPEN